MPDLTPEPNELPNSLDELFSTPPDELSEGQILQIVLALRAKREIWLAAEGTPKKSKAKAVAVDAPAQLDLGDLGL